MRNTLIYSLTFLLLLCFGSQTNAQQHPRLLLTKKGVEEIRSSRQAAPLFNQSFEQTRQSVDLALSQPMEVPIPKDAGGGYTHEVHKKNYLNMYNAGIVHQITGDRKYAAYVKEMLLKYAAIYPTLPLHPVQKSSYRGRLFWQGLNECVWLVHTSQAYDCIYDYLSKEERTNIEKNLFYPMCNFIASDNMETFNRIHNHGTWAVAAVGMAGYALGDKDLTEKALKGYNKDGKGGFLAQIEQLFSPDGYFTEGPYYQRYALQPFVMFAQVIENNDPAVKIFQHGNSRILKAVDVEFQLMEKNGQLFYLNDALYKTWHTTELVYALDIAYAIHPNRKDLLSIAKEQNKVILTEAGLKVARALQNGEEKPFVRTSLLLGDGAEGKDGALAILRARNTDETTALMKHTSHGLSHGHFDKLNICFYDNGKEILKDYGAARFLNIEPKNGGHYLSENTTFAKQTISHNTLVVDQQSHFKGDINISENYAPTHLFFKDTEKLSTVGAEDENAYPGVKMNRKIALVTDPHFEYPILVDVFTVNAKEKHQFDLPFYFMGHLISTNFDYTAHIEKREAFGKANGYQHLWVEAMGKTNQPTACLTFLNNNRFYSITTTVHPETELFINRIGAGDPNFNLQTNPCFILRDKDQNSRTYVSVIEPHGDFNPIQEYTLSPYSAIQTVELLENNRIAASVLITLKTGKKVTVEIKE